MNSWIMLEKITLNNCLKNHQNLQTVLKQGKNNQKLELKKRRMNSWLKQGKNNQNLELKKRRMNSWIHSLRTIDRNADRDVKVQNMLKVHVLVEWAQNRLKVHVLVEWSFENRKVHAMERGLYL
eukprot:XP_019919574.1 PREDICTED: uncharacterized protein LOC109617609 [Crassostrea gigas]